MNETVIADAGPVVAFLARKAEHHRRACDTMTLLRPPLLTCEAALAEAAHLLRRDGGDADALLALVERGVLRIELSVQHKLAPIRQLMRRYRDRPMSFGDACLVRLTELHDKPKVWTLDSDFGFYRRLGRLVIPTLMPERP